MGIQTALDSVRSAGSIVEGLRRADDLAFEASREGGARTVRILVGALDDADGVVAIAAAHALAQVFDDEADAALSRLLSHPRGYLREHAAWVLGSRLPRFDTIGRLIGLVREGGFAGMLAQRSLEQWAGAAPEHVAVAVEGALLGVRQPDARARLVETLGLVRSRIATRAIVEVASDEAEEYLVRAAAVAALGDGAAGRMAGPGAEGHGFQGSAGGAGGAGGAAAEGTAAGILHLLERLAVGEGGLARVAELALLDLRGGGRGGFTSGGVGGRAGAPAGHPLAGPRGGLTVAQLFLHADIDAGLSHVGRGDNGGIATLLVRLGDALVAGDPDAAAEPPFELRMPGRPEAPAGATAGAASPDSSDLALLSELAALADYFGTPIAGFLPSGAPEVSSAASSPQALAPVDRVITMSRGAAVDALRAADELRRSGLGHLYGRIPLRGEPVASAAAWPQRVEVRRGIRRILREAGQVDVLHLRMADVGSLAAADVARELDIPVVFTVAPDPHAVIRSLESAGRLTRSSFGDADADEHYWFRTRLVQRLAGNAAHTVLFPRPELARELRELVGIDITAHPERHSVVPEGIDLGVVDRGVAEASAHAAGTPATPPLAELRRLIETLPPERRALPIVLSVGRLHRVKGMAAVVEAWARSPLAEAANLLIVGGDLAQPSADERQQLDAVDALVPAGGWAAAGLLLPGHRPNDTVARWAAAARLGLPGLTAPGGVYVCGSVKEEFGIALLEALAAGLMVVAPDGGGPATYVEQGVTGFLTQTWSTERLAAAMGQALAAVAAETDGRRAELSRRVVEEGFTIEAMAAALRAVYAGVGEDAEGGAALLGQGVGAERVGAGRVGGAWEAGGPSEAGGLASGASLASGSADIR